MMAEKSRIGNERLDAHLRVEAAMEPDESDSSPAGRSGRRSALVIEHADTNQEQNWPS